MKILILALALLCGGLYAADITVDAADTSAVNLRKIFDAFRSANPAGPDRLRQIGSRQVRMFPPLSYRSYGFGNLFDVVKGTYPNWTFDFSLPDNDWVAPVKQQGADVILGYCYMPEALSNDALEPPSDYNAWEEFNFQWAAHYNEKFGVTTFEIWNEPDYSEFFTGSRSDYFEMYKYAVRGIRRAVPHARVGGPALAGNTGWIDPFLDYIISNDLPIHFISYHAQDNGFKDENSAYYNRYKEIVDALNARGMDSVSVILDEFSYELDPGQDSRYNRSEAAARFAGTFHFILNHMPRLSRFNKTITDNGDLADKWKYNGLVTTDNIPKAKFNVFRMYAMMPYRGVRVSTDNGIGAMASVSDSLLAVMIWNREGTAAGLSTVWLNNMPFTADSLELYTIDAQHSSYFDDPSGAELERLQYRPITADSVHINITPYSVNLLLIHRDKTINALFNTVQKNEPNTLQIAPNPFNGRVSCALKLAHNAAVSAAVFDAAGRRIHTFWNNQPLTAGTHRLYWDAAARASGIYYLRVHWEGRVISRKLLLIK